MIRFFFTLAFLFPLALGAHAANEPAELHQLRTAYTGKDEASRAHYILGLANLRQKYAEKDRNDDCFAVDAEVKKHALPANVDGKALSELFAGKWRSSRHDALYNPEGFWTMIPVENGGAHGHWHITGNKFFYSENSEPDGPGYTIILLDADNFIYTDGKYVFYEKRIK